jgi:thioredoxin 1
MSQDEELEKLKRKKAAEIEQSSSMPSHPVAVTDANFRETLQKYPFVVVDFWAAWCGPCRMVEPIVEELAKEYSGKVVFAKMNVDDNPLVPGEFGIQSIPTMLFFKNGKAVHGFIGARPKAQILAELKPYL